MPITINGSGSVTGISAGGLPDSCITTDDIAANAVTAAKLGADQASGLAKAWVNFNGTGTVAIRASFNVSSITDNGTGDYTVNFTTALADANYVATTMALPNDTAGTQGQSAIRGAAATGATTMTTTTLRINTGVTSSNLFVDMALVNVAIFR